MPTVDLRPNADNAIASIVLSTGTTAFSLINSDVDSPSDTTYVYQTTANGEDIAWIELDNVPADFAVATAAVNAFRYSGSGWSDDTWTIGVSVYAADKTTLYVSEATASGVGTNPAPTTTTGGTIQSAGSSASKNDWNGALLRIRLNISRNMGGDGGQARLIEFELRFTYDAVEAKTDIPTRRNTYTAKTITAALAQDQWGKYLVPQIPWRRPVRRGYNIGSDGAQKFDCAWSLDGRFVVMGGNLVLDIYSRSGTAFTKLTNPAPGGICAGCAWSPDGRFLAVAHSTTPFVTIYERSGITFTKLTDPGSLPTDEGNDVAFSPDGRFLAVAHATTPFVTIYDRNGTTFNKLANPTTLPTGTGFGCAFSPDGRFLAVAHSTTPFITIYERSGATFTKLTNPTTPPNTSNDVAFSPDGRFLAVAHSTTPFVTIYERSGTTFTKLANPTTLPAGTGNDVAFSPDGRFLAVAHATSPFVTIYERSGTTFTKLANPATLPTGTGSGCAFSPDGRFLAVSQAAGASPNALIYETSGLNPREGYLWMPSPGER